jgi:lipoprotein-anchoring transpeptidase ErfK/SrfK
MVRFTLLIFSCLLLVASPVFAAKPIDPEAVNKATFEKGGKQDRRALAIKLQILLDRAHDSPGIIDGRGGRNVTNALRMFEKRSNLPANGKLDSQVWDLLQQGTTEDVIIRYELTADDLKGPFVEKIPTDYAEMARMEHLSYTSPLELLSEKFQIHPDLLNALNPDMQFTEGSTIFVPNVRDNAPTSKVASIEVDKKLKTVRGYDEGGKLIVSYPATIGSRDTPSPEGTMKVKGVAENPTYSYRPEVNFQQGNNTEPLELPSGPNNPVGSVWIDLTKKTYGIHGTPDPENIGKTASHGCVRLTNWDAEELAKLVKPGVKVSFVNGNR